MGEARRRGTFRELQAAAVQRKRKETEARRLAHAMQEAAMTDEHRLARHKARTLLAMALGHTIAVGDHKGLAIELKRPHCAAKTERRSLPALLE